MRKEFHFPFWRSHRIAYYAAKAAFVFKDGKSRSDYDKALPYLKKYYSLNNSISEMAFDADSAAKSELEWWIIRRNREQHPPAEWENWLATTAAIMYHLPADSFREYSHLRVRAVRVDVVRSASNEVVAFMPADGNLPPILPGPPVGIARRTSPTTVALTWSPPVTGDAPDFYIVEVTDRNGDPVATLETGSAATFFYYTLPGVIHVVRVRAANAAGVGPAAPPLTIVMPR